MTDIKILPLPEADGFMETFDTYGCSVGVEAAWTEETVKEIIRANVAHVVKQWKDVFERVLRLDAAAKDAEIARLQSACEAMTHQALNDLSEQQGKAEAEIERLRAIAGCAYQMAGMHGAPEVWLDRLSQAANGDALPDPDTILGELLPYQPIRHP